MPEFMDHEKLRTKLIAAARLDAPAETVPYAFEKRIMARIAAKPVEDVLNQWGAALWKGAAACAAITVVSIFLSVWNFSDNDQTFETVVLAGADQLTESW
jgi:hypothetical protein